MAQEPKRRPGTDNIIDLDGAPPEPPKSERAYPETIKARYFIEDAPARTTFYRDYKGEDVAFRIDREGGRMTSKGDDIATVRDMLAVAEAEGWKSVKLSGSKDFRREAWIEAATRSIEADGYVPTDLDRQEADKRRARRDRDNGPENRDLPPGRSPTDDGRGPSSPNRPSDGPRAPDNNVLSLEIEKAARTTKVVQRDEARLERDEVRLSEDQARARPADVARDEARLQRDEARPGGDRARLSDAAQSILSAIGGRIDKEFTGLTGLEKEQLKDFTAGLLAAREAQVGRLQDPGPVPPRYAPPRAEPQPIAREPEPEPFLPLPRRERDAERSL